MKHITKKFIQKTPIALALIAASFIGAANVSAWGPERTTFTMEKPATYPTFNSITNNPTIGDERDFVRVGQINADVTELTNEVEVIPGHQYLVYIYFHNNASATFNDSAHNHSGVAVATRMASSFSTVLTPAEKAKITATITANNSNPGSVWDEAYMTTSTPKVLLHYVTGSAKIYNDWKMNGAIMPSSLFTEDGTLLGLNELNGVVPGCEEYHGVVTYVLQADELKGTIDKEVSADGTNYSTSVNATPGSEVSFRLTVKNAGDVAITNATVIDTMPAGLTLVPGSVQFSANNSGVWENLSDNITSDGYNFGTIGTGNFITITYRAKVSEDVDCNGLNLVNVASLTYDSESKFGDNDNSSTAVNVKKDDCEEPKLEDCTTNPALPGCNPEDCTTNPSLPGCDIPSEIPKTGPLEITMAVLVVLGLGASGFYFYRTRRTLKTVKNVVSGTPESPATPAETATPEAPATPAKPTAPASTEAPATGEEKNAVEQTITPKPVDQNPNDKK